MVPVISSTVPKNRLRVHFRTVGLQTFFLHGITAFIIHVMLVKLYFCAPR